MEVVEGVRENKVEGDKSQDGGIVGVFGNFLLAEQAQRTSRGVCLDVEEVVEGDGIGRR